MFDELIFSDNPLTMLDQVEEHSKDLGLKPDHTAGGAQLAALQIKFVALIEGINHGGKPQPRPERCSPTSASVSVENLQLDLPHLADIAQLVALQADEPRSIGQCPHVAQATLYAGNWVRCMRLPMLVLGSK
jgi:hypothetical protein